MYEADTGILSDRQEISWGLTNNILGLTFGGVWVLKNVDLKKSNPFMTINRTTILEKKSSYLSHQFIYLLENEYKLIANLSIFNVSLFRLNHGCHFSVGTFR